MTDARAVDLPEGSIVRIGSVVVQRLPLTAIGAQWRTRAGVKWATSEVQDLLDAGDARVLRYGYGESPP